ncbi:hypothetical protein NP493_4003g00010 [Ridgeia piscesae]|uniref:Uncharacterized protein n=1 Tax=Ridgeia piscesae TaxID=27915 RepID=A0AAD9J1Y6_RIDPI|nr:hypothetical protein NP493_4003g00010 [Ridgeia piscesae]
MRHGSGQPLQGVLLRYFGSCLCTCVSTSATPLPLQQGHPFQPPSIGEVYCLISGSIMTLALTFPLCQMLAAHCPECSGVRSVWSRGSSSG